MDCSVLRRSFSGLLPSVPGAIAAAFLLVALAFPGSGMADTLIYGCVLSNLQEVPPNASTALGGGQFVIDTTANTMTYRIVYTGLSAAETAAHIHGYAAPGVNAGVVHPLPAGPVKTGMWNYPAADEASILAGMTYVNIHSAILGGGEIRGQIVPFNALLDGAQEVPPVATAGRGFGVFTIDTATNQLNYYVAFAGLSSAETAAHIHGFALQGTNAGVKQGLPLGNPKVGSWNYAEADEASILAGQCYVNIHTMNFPGGEIRGQVAPLVEPIDSRQEVPPTGSSAAGIALIALDVASDRLGYDIRFAGLSSAETAAHIHGFAPPGVNAGVQHPLPPGSPKLGVWTYPAGDEANVLSGLTYVNIHSTMFPGGEIRGQLANLSAFQPAAVADPEGAPVVAPLLRIAPNPFGTETAIHFGLAREALVTLDVVDVSGRVVRELVGGSLAAGEHVVAWDGRDAAGRPVASGVYFGRLNTTAGTTTLRITRVR